MKNKTITAERKPASEKINKKAVERAIKATEEFLKNAKNKEQFTDYGLTIYGCDVRNLQEYKDIAALTFVSELDERLAELYAAI